MLCSALKDVAFPRRRTTRAIKLLDLFQDYSFGRRQAAEEWRFDTCFHLHSEGSSSLLATPQIGGGQKLLPCPSVWVIFWMLPPWLWRITGCGISISFRVFVVGIHEATVCDVNGWRSYQNLQSGKCFLLNSDTMLLTLMFRRIYDVFAGFISFWDMINDDRFDLVQYLDYLHVFHNAERNLEESLKIYCFIIMEIGDEEGRVFQYFGTSYILLRPSLSIDSFYPCLPRIQSCKTVYLHLNAIIWDNSEIVPSSMSGSKKVFLPFLCLGGFIAAERIKIWVSLVLQIKILPNLSRVVCVREGFCSDHIGIVFAFMGIGDPSVPGLLPNFSCAMFILLGIANGVTRLTLIALLVRVFSTFVVRSL
ncbi:hypothetical protein V6N13_041176 [Hibiscus sabdariffa]